MNNSVTPEIAAGIITSVSIILFVAFNIIRFNKERNHRLNA